jgi:UDP-3-O-[3-hydroxymyristoyl] glucosamine N-acyltransferase
MKLSEIAKLVKGDLVGDDVEITGISDLDSQSPGTIGYVDGKRHLEPMAKSSIAALIIPRTLDCPEKPCVKTDEPKLAFSSLLYIFSPYRPYDKGLWRDSYVHPNAKLGADVTVMPFAVVMEGAVVGDRSVIYPHAFIGKNVRIGADCIIKAGVKIDDETTLGDRVTVHHNSVIGGDGFNYVQKDGKNIKIPQIGRIRIGSDVEIGAGVMVDRAALSETVIGDGVKIDNLVQVAHNVKIGENSILCSQVGIAGSTSIGKNCILTGQVGVADHMEIGDNVMIMAQSGVEGRKVEDGKILFGSPAREFMEMKRIYAALPKLPELLKRVAELEKKLDEKNS